MKPELNEVISKDFAPLNDLDNRFLIKTADRENVELRDELARYASKVYDGGENSDAVTKTRRGGPRATILHDTASGREFAAIAYDSLDDNYPASMPPADPYISVNYTIGELKDGKMIGTPSEAMAKMGLQSEMGFPVDNKSKVAGDDLWWLSQGLQNMVVNQQKENRIELVAEGAKVDQRSIMYRQTQFEYAMTEHLEAQKTLIDSNVADMAHHRDNAVNGALTQDEREEHDTRMWAKLDIVKEQRADALRAIVSPEKFEVDKDNRIKPADGVVLANHFAQTKGDKMTALGDINNMVRIGKVSEEALQASTVIQEGDTVLSSIRLKQFGSEADTNIYTVKTQDGQSWIRAEYIDDGELRATNGDALAVVNINGNQLNHGGETPETDVIKQILPESLRQKITSQQLSNHKNWMMSNMNDNPPQEYMADNYVYALSNNSTSPDSLFYAARELLASRVDNRFSVSDLDPDQINRIETFGLIPGSDKPIYGNIEYRGGVNGFIIKDHSDDTVQLIGQHLVERTDDKDASIKKIEVRDFDLVLKQDATEIDYGYDGLTRGNILIAVNPEQESNLIKVNNKYPVPVTSEYDGKSYKAEDSIKWNGSHIMAAIAQSADVKNTYDPKADNNYGMGERHPAFVKLDNAAKSKKDDASQEVQVTADATVQATKRIKP